MTCSVNSKCPLPAKPSNRLASLSSERCTRGQGLQHCAAMTKTEYNKKYWVKNKDSLILANKEYYKNNRSKLIQSARLYVSKNKQSTDAYQQKYRMENREKRKQQCRKWRKEHPDRARKSHIKYRAENYESVRRSESEYNRIHPEKNRKMRHKRRAQKSAAKIYDVEKINQWEIEWRNQILVQCFYCKNILPPSQCHLDHKHPLNPRKGQKKGDHSPKNVVIACSKCNQRKNNMPLKKWMMIIKQGIL